MGLYVFAYCGTTVYLKDKIGKKKIETLVLPDVQKYSKIITNIKAKGTDH